MTNLTAEAASFSWLLEKFVGDTIGVTDTIAVSSDGLLLAAAMTTKPQNVECEPFSIFSLPRLGPTVRSSMISTGAARLPARNKSARSFASFTLPMPSIWKRLPSWLWMTGAVMTSSMRRLVRCI